MSGSTIKTAILGTGLSLTAFHHPLLTALPDLFTVHSVLERSGKETSRAIVGDKVKIVTTYEEVINDAEVDLVVVSTPNRTHFDYVRRALEAGKHGMSPLNCPCWNYQLTCSDVREAIDTDCQGGRGAIRDRKGKQQDLGCLPKQTMGRRLFDNPESDQG
jgi:hypothetical protein